MKNRSRWEPAVATHMASRKSVPINRRSPILAGHHESRPEGVLLSGAGLVITFPRFSLLVSRHNLDSQELRGHTSFQCGTSSLRPICFGT